LNIIEAERRESVQDGDAEAVLGFVQRASVVAEVVARRQQLGVLRQNLHVRRDKYRHVYGSVRIIHSLSSHLTRHHLN